MQLLLVFLPETRRAKMTLEAMRPAGSSATEDVATFTLSDGVCGSGDAGSCEFDVILC